MKATLFAYTILPLAKLCSAQTYTSCDPTKKSCPDNPALSTFSYSHSFADGFDDANWEVTSANVTHTPSGLLFPIKKSGDNPTIRSKWYIFGGRISYIMRTAPGTGIVSSGMMLSDDLDELDFEFLGGEPTIAQTIYFGKGKTGNRNQVLKVNVPNTQTTTHNFTIVWGKDSTEFYIDGAIVRTLTTTEATTGGQTYPQTPMVVRVGSWAGGDASNSPGTIEWAGGSTDYTKGPFNMLLERIEIESFNPGESYTWRDTSGTWDSIEVNGKANHTSVVKDVKADSDSAVSAAHPAGSTSTMPGSSNGAGSRRAARHWLIGGLLVVIALVVY